MKLRPLAFGLAALIVAINLVGERVWMNIGVEPSVLIPGLAAIHPTFNRGVSFSLLTQDADSGRYLLMAGLAVLSAGVAVMAWRSTTWWAAAGYGLILGGALGNLVDRAIYGAVFDFLYLHLGDTPLFICNFADIAISAGVALLLAESLFVKPKPV